MKRLVVMLIMGIVLAMAAGCSSEKQPEQDPAALVGPLWKVTEYRAASGALVEPLATARMTALFRDATNVNGSGGINTYNATYEADSGSIAFGRVAATLMAGPPAVMDAELAYFRCLEDAAGYAVSDTSLQLFDDENNLLVSYEVGKPVAFEGTEWTCVSFNNGRDALVSVIASTTVTATFADGALTGSAGVNQYNGTYFIEADRLTIPPDIATTQKAGPEDAMSQEAAYLAVLPRATTYQVTDDVLTIMDTDGVRLAVYRALGDR